MTREQSKRVENIHDELIIYSSFIQSIKNIK